MCSAICHPRAWPSPRLSPQQGMSEQDRTCMPSEQVKELRTHVLTGLLPILQMAPSEGTVTQIGLLSQDIHRLTVGHWPSLSSRAGAGETSELGGMVLEAHA